MPNIIFVFLHNVFWLKIIIWDYNGKRRTDWRGAVFPAISARNWPFPRIIPFGSAIIPIWLCFPIVCACAITEYFCPQFCHETNIGRLLPLLSVTGSTKQEANKKRSPHEERFYAFYG
jgi:hypothetical protein